VLRYRLLRSPLDLHTGLAFGVLALGNLFAVWASSPTRQGDMSLELSMYLLLLSRAMAAVLFLTGLAWTFVGTRPTRPPWPTLLLLGVVAALMLAIVLGAQQQLPMLLDATARDLLNDTTAIADFLPGQSLVLVAANAAIAAGLCVAAIGYTVAARRLLDPYLSALATALALLFFGQLHAILVPAVASDFVTTGDVFRLIAYGLLVSSLAWRTAADVAARTARSERLRLSRELHDGLAQQLALLRLRLARAAELASPASGPAYDLEVAQRLVEAASLEARQAIAALRAERVSWDVLEQALTSLANEFAQNHDVEVSIQAAPMTLAIDGLLESELLRIVLEACSNAIRHGQAGRIWVQVSVVHRELRLGIRDDGHGFKPSQESRGVGLRSMAERVERRGGRLLIESASGQGTSIHVWLPLS
jgi:signal transduction histidine kinase